MGLVMGLAALSGCSGDVHDSDQAPGWEELADNSAETGTAKVDVLLLTDVHDVPGETADFSRGPDSADSEEAVLPRACALGEGCFLDECDDNSGCQSGWCVQHLGEGVCSQTCQEECPQGWTCKQVAETEPDVVYICVSDYANLCRPCATNADCTSTGGAEDACIYYGPDGSFCGGPCGEGGGMSLGVLLQGSGHG